MRANPFTSNLENAKLLALVTKERVQSLNLDQNLQDRVASAEPGEL